MVRSTFKITIFVFKFCIYTAFQIVKYSPTLTRITGTHPTHPPSPTRDMRQVTTSKQRKCWISTGYLSSFFSLFPQFKDEVLFLKRCTVWPQNGIPVQVHVQQKMHNQQTKTVHCDYITHMWLCDMKDLNLVWSTMQWKSVWSANH